jgi:hypothetical protein
MKLNEQLYAKHLECAALWPSLWHSILNKINESLQIEMETHYENLNKKLDKLQGKCNTPEWKTDRWQQTTYPRTTTSLIYSSHLKNRSYWT